MVFKLEKITQKYGEIMILMIEQLITYETGRPIVSAKSEAYLPIFDKIHQLITTEMTPLVLMRANYILNNFVVKFI